MVFSIILSVVAFLCIYRPTGRLLRVFNIDYKSRKVRLIRLAVTLVLSLLCLIFQTLLLFFIHLLVFLTISDGIAALLRLIAKKYRNLKAYRFMSFIYRSGLAVILVIVSLFVYGYINMNNVTASNYTVTSDKVTESYRVVFISDTHYGTIQNPDILKNKINEINRLKPDLVILGGDIIEEGTSKEDMYAAFEALSQLRAKYGTYYIYGNHDRQRYNASPLFTEAELSEAIAQNGITVLAEEVRDFGEIQLVGREEKTAKERKDTAVLAENTDQSKFILLADHQPTTLENNKPLKADLQLSGHTHGGQIFPLGYIGFLYDDLVYGEYEENGSKIIVSSGFAGWGFPIRTQGKSEYVIVNIKPNL